jgi:hypothetical protein
MILSGPSKAASACLHPVPCYDPEHRELGRHLLEHGQGRILLNRQMRSGTAGALQIRLQHSRTAVGRDFFQMHLLAPTVTESDVSPGSLHVPHPVGVRTKHGHQIALTLNHHHHKRHTDDPTGPPAHHFEADQLIRRNSE